MSQSSVQATAIVVASPQLVAQIPQEPVPSGQVVALSALATTPDSRGRLICKDLLVGDTLARAREEARKVFPEMMANTQVVAVFGTDSLDGVNRLNDRMLSERPPVDIPELREAMKNLSRRMRGIGSKYDPNDPKVLAKYARVKDGILSRIHLGKTFLQEFLDDVRSLDGFFDEIEKSLSGRQFQLLKNVGYYDEFYQLNEREIANLIYKIGVMEIIRDMAAEYASRIPVGDSNAGDRGAEERAKVLELVTFMENKIIAFKGRLWVAWAMAPQIRTMRAMSVGLSARVDETVGITIPTMKGVVVVWQTMSEAQQAEQFNSAVEGTYNAAMMMFANAAKVSIPAMATALSRPALDPRTVLAWSESLSAQADGIIVAIEAGQKKRAELEQAMIAGKTVIDAATQRVNNAQIELVLKAAQQPAPEVRTSIPPQP